MAISNINYSNTFGQWLVSTNQTITEVNSLKTDNYTKTSGTLYLDSSSIGLSVSNNSLFSGNTTFSGGTAKNLSIYVPSYFYQPVTIASNTSITATGNIFCSYSFANTIFVNKIDANNIIYKGLYTVAFNGNFTTANNITVTGNFPLQINVSANSNITLPPGANTLVASGFISNADIIAGAGIVDTKLATIATAGKVSNSATTANSSNSSSTIVARDTTGSFSTRNINLTATTGTAPLTVSSTTLVTNLNADLLDGFNTNTANSSSTVAVRQADGSLEGNILKSTVATGTAPLTVSSTTLVTNLNADLLDGFNTNTANSSSTVAVRQADGSLEGNILKSTVATGTAPLTVTSTTLVTNLNADLLDGFNTNTANSSSTVAVRKTDGSLEGRTLISTVATGTAPLAVTSNTLVTNLNADLLDGYHVGTSGASIPLLNGINTWSGTQTVNASLIVSGDLTISGNTISSGATINDSGDYILRANTGSTSSPDSNFIIKRNSPASANANNATIRWDNTGLNWKINDVTNNNFYNVLIDKPTQTVTGSWTFSSNVTLNNILVSSNTISGTRLLSTVATGTAPLAVTSNTLVTNLNADLLDGYHVGTSGSAIPILSAVNTWTGTQNFLAVQNWFGTSTSNTASNSAIEIGLGTNIPYIDFHSSNTAVDYNARISCTGETGVGGGTLSFAAATSNFTGNVGISSATTISTNSLVDALRITQTGSGNALVVEDSANPDSTPFVIDASGKVIMGGTSGTYPLNLQNSNYAEAAFDSVLGSSLILRRAATSITLPTIVANGNLIGSITFRGYDGSAYRDAASIYTYIDNTPDTNDMPGRLVFSTTAKGNSVTTERMRITSNGNVLIGTTTDDGQKLQVNGSFAANSIISNGTITATGEVVSTSVNQFRSVQGNFGAFIRNDGTNVYLLQTANGSPYGTFNSFRPFYWNLTTGDVNIASNGNTAWFGGPINIPDNKNLNVGSGNDLYLIHNGTNSIIGNQTGNLNIANYALTGGIALTANGSSGANFELWSTAAYLDSTTSYFRSQDGGTTFGYFNSNGLTIPTSTTSSAYNSGALVVTGGVGIGNSTYLERADTDIRLYIRNLSSTVARYPGLSLSHFSGNGSTDFGGHNVLEMTRYRGTSATPTAVQSGDILGGIAGWGYNGTATDDVARIYFKAESNFDGVTDNGSIEFHTQNGTTLSKRLRIVNDGSIDFTPGTITSQFYISHNSNTHPLINFDSTDYLWYDRTNNAYNYIIGGVNKAVIGSSSVTIPNQLISTVTTGTAPLAINSTTLVANLNSQLLGGSNSAYYTNATNLLSGTVPTARLGSGTANSTTVLYGDSTWKTVTSGATINNDIATNSNYYPLWATANTGAPATIYTSSQKYYFNPSTGTLNATIFNSLSDQSQKTDIKLIDNALNIINNIEGVEFTWKDTGKKSSGVIAQQLEEILPELVNTDIDSGLKSVNYSGIIGYLIQSVKELSEKVAKLERNV